MPGFLQNKRSLPIEFASILARLKRSSVLLLFFCIASNTGAQCEFEQLSNPSFEVGSANMFSGWNQFNAVSETAALVQHGNRAVQFAGTNSGGWDVSAVWQKQNSQPGDVWEARLFAGHQSINPLAGPDIRLLVNFEWRDAAGEPITGYPNASDLGYQSFTILTQASPTDTLQEVVLTSLPAPPGTAAIHLLVGLLQSPAMEPGAAIVDSVYLRETTGTQIEDLQWNDFVGGRTLAFRGHDFRVKGPGFFGPGGNWFSDQPNAIWVDANGELHMTIRNNAGSWQSTEIASEAVPGYGDYRFTVRGDLSNWASNVVFGFFHWQYPLCFDGSNPWNLHNEMDVELSRWNDPANPNSIFVVQPHPPGPGGSAPFETSYTAPNELTTFAYRWLPDRVEYRAWKGDAQSEQGSPLVSSWVYSGPYIPREDIARMHLNFWQFNGPPNNGQDHEIVISDFVFLPAGASEANVPLPNIAALLLLLTMGTVYFYSRET